MISTGIIFISTSLILFLYHIYIISAQPLSTLIFAPSPTKIFNGLVLEDNNGVHSYNKLLYIYFKSKEWLSKSEKSGTMGTKSKLQTTWGKRLLTWILCPLFPILISWTCFPSALLSRYETNWGHTWATFTSLEIV